MQISASKIKIFKIKNRKGYAALCLNHLTEGRTLPRVYDRMEKALRRNGIDIRRHPSNLKNLVKKSV
jgi:hypothetical protein